MSQSLYDLGNSYEDLKMKSDAIYGAFMDRDTTQLDSMINDIKKIAENTYPSLSERFKELSERTLNGNVRIAKHAFLLFGLYLTPEYAKTLVQPKPKVDPMKFQLFYTTELPVLCNKLLNGKYTSLQEFVENARTTYIIL